MHRKVIDLTMARHDGKEFFYSILGLDLTMDCSYNFTKDFEDVTVEK